jgi:hypothetical protein
MVLTGVVGETPGALRKSHSTPNMQASSRAESPGLPHARLLMQAKLSLAHSANILISTHSRAVAVGLNPSCIRLPDHLQLLITWLHDAHEAPATGFAALYVSSAVSASHDSGYLAVLACGSCKCLYAGVAGGSHSALHVTASPPFFMWHIGLPSEPRLHLKSALLQRLTRAALPSPIRMRAQQENRDLKC